MNFTIIAQGLSVMNAQQLIIFGLISPHNTCTLTMNDAPTMHPQTVHTQHVQWKMNNHNVKILHSIISCFYDFIEIVSQNEKN